ncbi:hypothetical protein J437_LFUL017688 [Ladona fulva]|uniref:acid phosphatase n=1 Tax=Ladona fulva TaxID=123851 RepID=A0A8K0P2M6_LADFU|nr:hypothetical protein J437_LFUL017688 [Ladona fulva]
MGSCFKILCIVVVAHITYASRVTANEEDLGSLQLVHIIFRHGDRTPVEPYPNDPYKNVSLWPVGWGQLTNVGKRQHYHLGKFFRRRYADFLSTKYLKEEVYVRSTDVDRTLMSVESNLAGLYPPVENQVWEPGMTWQPIPVHTVPESLDEVLSAKKPCPLYDEMVKKVKQSPEIKMKNEENKALYQYLTEKTGKYVHDLFSLENVYNTLFIEETNNFTLPEWTKSVYPDKMVSSAALSFSIAAYDKDLQRLKMGPLMGEILKHMKRKVEGTSAHPKRKLFIYSGHDTTIANVLNTLGLFNPRFCPPYASTIAFELYLRKNGVYYVSTLYKNGTQREDFVPLTIPGCLQECPLENFVELMKPIIPSDWARECERGGYYSTSRLFATSGALPLPDLALIALITSGTTALILTIAIFAVMYYWCRRRESHNWYFRLNSDDT